MQVGVKTQVALDAEIHVQGALLEHHADVAQRGHRVVADRVAGDHRVASIGDEQAGEQLEQGGFAGAVGPQQGHEAAGLQRHGQSVERDPRAVALAQALYLYRH